MGSVRLWKEGVAAGGADDDGNEGIAVGAIAPVRGVLEAEEEEEEEEDGDGDAE